MFMLVPTLAAAVLVIGAASHQTAQARRRVLGGSFSLLIGLSGIASLTELPLPTLAAQTVEAEASEGVGVQAEVDSSDAVSGLSAAGDQVPDVSDGRQLESTEETVLNEESSAPIERKTDVLELDYERYPEWLKEFREVREVQKLGSRTFSLASIETTEDDVRFAVVESPPGLTLRECQNGLEQRLVEATNEYINDYLNSSRASVLVRYTADEIRSKLVRDTFEERIAVQGDDWRRVNALIAFDDSFRRDLDERWGKLVAGARLIQTGFGAAVVLLLLGTLFGYFRFDTATRGYYTGRLQFATFGAILGVLAAGVLVARIIPWM